MKYLCLIYHDAPSPDVPSPPELAAYDDDLCQGNHLLAAHTLDDTRATIVRVRGGRLFLDDGPCAPTTAPLTGYHLIEARDLNEAIRLASRNPAARLGSIEIRPVREP